ncbi:MAG: TMAO reductase system sensor histidine kinase/response regulator TorS [Rhodospirillales bacterium]|nr:TMAO reductase system sensor histidine kinase/response regulator TorS [Rhodospirillales bacterium]
MFGRFGIASRLFAAFAGVAALSIAAGIIGWVVLRNVDTAQTTIVDQAMPAISEGRIIAETSSRIAARGALLATAESQAERQAEAHILRSTTDLLSARLDALEGYGFPEGEVAELRGVVSALAANLERQDEAVAARIDMNAVLAASVARSLEAAGQLSALSETLTSNAASGATVVISNLYELVEDRERLPATLDAFDRLVEADLFLLERMFEMRMRASEQGLLLNQLSRARDAAEIAWIEERYRGNLRILPRRVALIDDPIRREQAGTLVAALEADGPPGTLGLFDMRRRTLALDAALASLADDNRALTDRMNEGVAAVVSRSQLIAANASQAADSAVEFGGLTVLLQIVLFIAIAGAIAWLYVHRNLVHRLRTLHRVMQNLAGERLDVTVPTGGSDELSDMAKTVLVFRNNLIDKQELEEEQKRTNAELRKHKEELEELVAERTAQLTDANARLVDEVQNHDRARARAEEASRAKSEFLATMSHEIRTPMNGVLGMLRLMADGPLNERQHQQVRVMRSSSEILLGILNDILDYSRVESGEIEVDNAVFDLHELVEDIVVLMQGRAREKELALDLAIADGVPAAVTGDRQKLSQVLLNLLGNGIKFTDRGAVSLAVSSGPERDAIRLAVQDTGPGIAEPDLAQLFEPFYQAASSRRRGHQTGTGLGLAISRRLVTAMGGRIAVETKPGEGSCFSVTLPLPQSEAAAQAPTEAVPHGAAGPESALSVLVVEDNVVNAMVVEAFLARMGHEPLVAPTAEEGLALLETQTFDLVLMDISLPGIDGIEATQRIRAHASPAIRSLPVIAMSAHVFDSEVAQHLQSGMDAFIGKPIAPDGLADTIARVLGHAGEGREGRGGEPDAGEHGSIIDPTVLAEDRAVLGAERGALMINTFVETAPVQIDGIRQALAEGRIERAADLAHALRGAAGSLGLRRLADRCGVLEARARTPEAAALADDLGSLFEESREALVTLWAGLDSAERSAQVVTAGVNT